MRHILRLMFLLFLMLGSFVYAEEVDGLTGKYYLGDYFGEFLNKPDAATKEIDKKHLVYFNIDETINFDKAHLDRLRASDRQAITVVWDGYVYVKVENDYQFKVEKDDKAILFIDGKEIIKSEKYSHNPIKQVHLSKGKTRIRLVYLAGGGQDNVKLKWGWSDKPIGDVKDEDLEGIIESKWLKTNTDDLYYPKTINGLTGDYFYGNHFGTTGAETILDLDTVLRRKHSNDQEIDFDKDYLRALNPKSSMTVVWDGYIKVDESKNYSFNLRYDNGAKIYIDRKEVFATAKHSDWTESYKSIDNVYLLKGNHRFRMVFYAGGNDNISLKWKGSHGDAVISGSDFQTFFEPQKNVIVQVDTFNTNPSYGSVVYIDLSLISGLSGSLKYKTQDLTAVGGLEFEKTSGTLNFDQNNKNQTIILKIKNNPSQYDKEFLIRFYDIMPAVKGSLIRYVYNDSYLKAQDIKITIRGKRDDADDVFNNTKGVLNTERDFGIRNPKETRNIYGNVVFLGNTILCPKDENGVCLQDTSVRLANNNVDLKYVNTSKFMDSSKEIIKFNNSSKAKIAIPNDATVVWAGLYTQGYLHDAIKRVQARDENGNLKYYTDPNTGLPNYNDPVMENITIQSMTKEQFIKYASMPTYIKLDKFKDRIEVKSSVVNFLQAPNGYSHSSFTDITKYFKDANGAKLKGKDVNGWVSVMGVKSQEGATSTLGVGSLGNFGAWTLVLIYEQEDESYKNISVFDGYRIVENTNKSKKIFINVDGFLTPLSGEVKSALSVFAGEGDRYIDNDYIKLNNQLLPGGKSRVENGGFFRSVVLGVEREPSIKNNQGIDIHNYDVGTKIHANKYITNNQQNAVVELGTTGDTYFPSVVAFSTELYEPKVCYDFAYSQDGINFTAQLDKNNQAQIKALLNNRSDVKVSLYLRSIEKTDLYLKDIELDIYDINTTKASYDKNSTCVTKRGETRCTKYLDPNDPNQFFVDIKRAEKTEDEKKAFLEDKDSTFSPKPIKAAQGIKLGSVNDEDSIYMYYTLKLPKDLKLDSNKSKPFMDINAKIRYKLTLPGFEGEYEKVLTDGTVPICSNKEVKYDPIWGKFNVATKDVYKKLNEQATSCNESTCPKFNIPTQVVNKPSHFLVTSHSKDLIENVPYIKEKPIPTIVGVDVFNVAGFHFTKANCDNYSANISQRIWIPMFEGTKNISQVELEKALENMDKYLDTNQTVNSFIEEASRNASFRVITNLADTNRTFLEIEPLENGKYKIKDYQKYLNFLIDRVNLYNPDSIKFGEYEKLKCGGTHFNITNQDSVINFCGVAGKDSQELDYAGIVKCSECLVGYSNENTCSRDNFSVRPESIYAKISDGTNSFEANKTGVMNDDLNKTSSPIAADYDYDFEFRATAHNDTEKDRNGTFILKAVKGYEGLYKKASTEDRRAFFKWSSKKAPVVCNDINDKNVTDSVYFINGIATGKTLINNVGEYNLTIRDQEWTEVDWKESDLEHHRTAKTAVGGTITDIDVTKFFVQESDCKKDISKVPSNTTNFNYNGSVIENLNGCLITNENHTDEDSNVTYAPNPFEVKPFRFTYAVRNHSTWDNGGVFGGWMYMTNIRDFPTNENRSVHFDGSITAESFTGRNLSNFVNGCYAYDLNLTLGMTHGPSSAVLDSEPHKIYRVSDVNRSGALTPRGSYDYDYNATSTVLDANASSFYKDLNGTMQSNIRFNFLREVNNAINPILVNFNTISAGCADENNCTMNANGTPNHRATLNFPLGAAGAGNSLTFLYGRTFSPDVEGVSPINTFLRYETFCNTAGKAPCVEASYAFLTGRNGQAGEQNWIANTAHNSVNQGRVMGINLGTYTDNGVPVSGVSATARRINPNILVNGVENNIELTGTAGRFFTAIMHQSVSNWLLFSTTVPPSTTNDNIVEFIGESRWAGEGSLGSVVEESNTTNRVRNRLDW